MDKNAQSMIELLISSDIEMEEDGYADKKAPTSYAMTKAIQLLEKLGKQTAVPFVNPTPDGEGGVYFSWDCESANVTVHIWGSPKGGTFQPWDGGTPVPAKDYIYYDFQGECGTEENISVENTLKWLEKYKEACIMTS